MASKEEIQRKNIEEANEALGKQLSLVTEIQDQMANLISKMREKGTLDKLSLDSVKSAVSFTKGLKGEYDSLADVQKDIKRQQQLQNDILNKQKSAIEKASDGVKEEVKMLKVKEGSLTKAQNKLAKMESDKRLGKKVDEALYAQAQATVSKKEEQYNLAKEILTPEAEQLILLEKTAEALAEGEAHLAEQDKRQRMLLKNQAGIVDGLSATGKILDKLGASKLAVIFKDSADMAKKLTYEQSNGGKIMLSTWQKLGIGAKAFGATLKAALGPMTIMLAIVGGIVAMFKKQKERLEESVKLANEHAQATADMGRNLGVSSAKAGELAAQATAIGGAMGMTGNQAKEALGAIYSSLGGVEKLSNSTMQIFMKLKKFAGMSADDIKNIYTFSKLTGQEAGIVAKEMGLQAQQSIKSLKLNVSMKQLMQDVGKVSSNVKIQFQGSAKGITAAVAQAKKLGLEMKDVENIAGSLLNIEDSLAAEMEAELLTGKELNLEKARAAALNGDSVKLMEALSEQGITQADYANMNVIQQEALAKSLGMNRDQMSSMLVTQKENTSSNQDQLDLQQKGIEAMMTAATVLEQRAAEEERLKDAGAENNENMNKLIEAGLKLKETLQPIVDAIFTPILELVTDITTWIVDKLVGGISTVKDDSGALKTNFEALGPLVKGIAITWAGIKATQFAINTYKKISQGYDKIKKSDTLFFARYRMMEAKDWITLQGKKMAGYVKEKAALLANKAVQAASFMKDVGIAAMRAISSLASIPVVGWGLGLAAAGAVAALAVKYMNDGVQGPVSGGGGYSRTMFGPEGAIKFNDKDTIIAGTNLGGGGDSGNDATVAELRRVSALLQQLLNKEGGVYIDGNKVGATIALTNYQQQ